MKNNQWFYIILLLFIFLIDTITFSKGLINKNTKATLEVGSVQNITYYSSQEAVTKTEEFICIGIDTHCVFWTTSTIHTSGTITTQMGTDIVTAFEHITPSNSSKGIYTIATELAGNPPSGHDGDDKTWVIYYKMLYGNAYYDSTNDLLQIDCGTTLKPITCDNMLGLLAHNLVHIIQNFKDSDEEVWLNDSIAELVMFACGYQTDLGAINLFCSYPSQPLEISYSESLAHSEYIGELAAFGCYLYDTFSGPFISALISNTSNGVFSINNTLASLGYSVTYNDIFAQWITANLVNDNSVYNGIYGYKLISKNPMAISSTFSNFPLTSSSYISKSSGKYLCSTSLPSNANGFTVNFSSDYPDDFQLYAVTENSNRKDEIQVKKIISGNNIKYTGYDNVILSLSNPITSTLNYSIELLPYIGLSASIEYSNNLISKIITPYEDNLILATQIISGTFESSISGVSIKLSPISASGSISSKIIKIFKDVDNDLKISDSDTVVGTITLGNETKTCTFTNPISLNSNSKTNLLFTVSQNNVLLTTNSSLPKGITIALILLLPIIVFSKYRRHLFSTFMILTITTFIVFSFQCSDNDSSSPSQTTTTSSSSESFKIIIPYGGYTSKENGVLISDVPAIALESSSISMSY